VMESLARVTSAIAQNYFLGLHLVEAESLRIHILAASGK